MASVLIVEDSYDVAQPLMRVLQYAGHVVEWAGHGQAALRSVETTRPDFIVLDLNMPAMDGEEFLTHLRQNPALSCIKVIAYTGQDSVPAGRLADLGVSQVLLKGSTDPETLLSALQGAPCA
jgi:CheY-like chemotaxis protein